MNVRKNEFPAVVSFRVTAEDRKMFDQLAEQNFTSKSEFIRKRMRNVLSKKVVQ